MNYEEYTLSFQEILLYSGQGSAVCALISYTFYRSWLVFFILLPAGLFYPVIHRKVLKEKRFFRLNQEFKEGILILAANLSAGYSIENALVNSGQELDMRCGGEHDPRAASSHPVHVRAIRGLPKRRQHAQIPHEQCY